ncbi:DUF5134 domain-containing protein [Kibdelosporangium philippinense]|uniref:DUF5134 domain-containing protein n=1 Tax=Kibdelosporangium philippinense TaxID=211113 RepID=A0ABS8ZHZ4_9PSEU|nr:DUF5134 domain-containing protein [Kibdelosporangium philippinense]MCE7005457.1 DUF5134 domain-containing protein [Kibdelosporangium philippinense]
MAGPIWIRWLLTAALLATAGFYIRRLATAGRQPAYPDRDRAADVAHIVMATGMAVMSSPIGGPLSPASWLTLFCVLTAAAAVRGHLDLAVASAAMAYMLAAGTHDAHHMSGPWVIHQPGLALPYVAWGLAGYFLAYAVWCATRLSCVPRVVMALGMSYMLVTAV